MRKTKRKAKLYASIINGKVITGYNKDLLKELSFFSKLSNKLNNK